MKRGIVVLATTLAAVSTCCQGAGTQIIKSRDGSCQISVPESWILDELGAGAASPDKALTVAVSSPKMIDSFSELKQTATTVYKKSKVVKDTATEFVMEGESITGVPDIYRAIPGAAGKYCIVDVTYKTGSPDHARAIGSTLQPAK